MQQVPRPDLAVALRRARDRTHLETTMKL